MIQPSQMGQHAARPEGADVPSKIIRNQPEADIPDTKFPRLEFANMAKLEH
jgi:hypothetical protein